MAGIRPLNKALLDTDVLSEIGKAKDPTVAANAKIYRRSFGHYTLSTVTVMEVVSGFQRTQAAGRLLGAHKARRADGRPGQRLGRPAGRGGPQRRLLGGRALAGPVDRLGQAPVDDQRLAVLADDDVGRLEVAMQHAPAVRVRDGVADVEEAAEQLAQGQGPLACGRARAPGRVVSSACWRTWARTSSSSRECLSAARAPWPARIAPRGLSFSNTHAFMPAIRASRPMKSICSARMPNRRLRSASRCTMACPGDQDQPSGTEDAGDAGGPS